VRLITYRQRARGSDPRLGVLQGDRVLDVARLTGDAALDGMLALLERGPGAMAAVAGAAAEFAQAARPAGSGYGELALPVWGVELLAPLPRPRSIRDFYAFEQHVATAHRKRGRDVPKAWYEIPVFYFGNTTNIYGPDATVPMPRGTNQLDFELELACVIGQAGRDIPAAAAWGHIAGYTIMNDWSARDVQRQEVSVGLGPAKAKDFATSLGPALVTPDELADCFHDGRHDLTMVARVSGEEVSRGNAASIHWTFARMIERASQNVELLPGDVIGSGTVGTGCLLELGEDVHPWLRPGDEVELEIERLGRLRNRIMGDG